MKFSADKFKRSCTCLSKVGCPHRDYAELDALNAMVDSFAEHLKAKLAKRLFVKKTYGWDSPEYLVEQIQAQLVEHISKGDPIDVAAFAMFWWNKE